MLKYPKHFCWNKKKLASHSFSCQVEFEFFVFRQVSFFRLNDATIDVHNATSVLNQNNHTTFYKLNRYVLVTPRLILLYKVAYGNSIPEETNASLESFTVLFFPGKHGIVVLYFREVRRHFGFVCRVSSSTSWRECVLGVNEVAGVCGVLRGRDEGRYLTVSLLFSFFLFRRWRTKKFKGKRNTLLSLFR